MHLRAAFGHVDLIQTFTEMGPEGGKPFRPFFFGGCNGVTLTNLGGVFINVRRYPLGGHIADVRDRCL